MSISGSLNAKLSRFLTNFVIYIYLKSELTENPAEKRIILPSTSRIVKIGQYLAFERSSKIEDNICDLADEGNLT